MYCATEHPERIRSFRAGEVSVAYEKATPESLRTAAEEMLAAYRRTAASISGGCGVEEHFRVPARQNGHGHGQRGDVTARAFLQPQSDRTPETPEITPAGVVDGRRWRVIAQPLSLTGPVTFTTQRGLPLLRWEEIGGHLEASRAGRAE
jgi:hypothetical protein